jgi:hypothetical protein
VPDLNDGRRDGEYKSDSANLPPDTLMRFPHRYPPPKAIFGGDTVIVCAHFVHHPPTATLISSGSGSSFLVKCTADLFALHLFKCNR